jgi:ketosteroid isomerase-like protein
VSPDRVEVVRRMFAHWARGDFRPAARLYDPNVVLLLRTEFPDAGVYVGRDAVADYMRDLLESYETFAIEGEEFVGAGDSVVVHVRQVGTGVLSGLQTDLRYFQVFTFRGPSIIRIESIATRAEALAAVGLAE